MTTGALFYGQFKISNCELPRRLFISSFDWYWPLDNGSHLSSSSQHMDSNLSLYLQLGTLLVFRQLILLYRNDSRWQCRYIITSLIASVRFYWQSATSCQNTDTVTFPTDFFRRNLPGHSGPLRLHDGFLAYGVSFGTFRVTNTLLVLRNLGLLTYTGIDLGLLADAGVDLEFLAYSSSNLFDLIPSAYMVIMLWV